MKKIVLVILVSVVAVFLAYALFGVASGFMDAMRHGGSTALREGQLADLCKKLNQSLPQKVDEQTMLMATKAGPGIRFTYVDKLIHLSSADVDKAALVARIKPGAIERYRTSPRMADFRKWEAEVCHEYLDKDGNEVASVLVSLKDLQ